MSRLESKKAAGYFPTPQGVVARIVSHLSPPRSRDYRWLDPCAGEGKALAYLASVLGGETYGIELDSQRAEAAARRLDHTRDGDYAATRLPKGHLAGISAMLLNPPYDTDDTAGGRLELAFLRDTQDWLAPGGILIYIIPKHRISGYIARRLGTHFEDVRCWRFPDPQFERFRQVVIFARKRAYPQRDDDAILKIAMAQKGHLDILPFATDVPYQIPPRPDEPFYFRRSEYEPDEVLEEAHRAGVWTTKGWTDLLTPRLRQTVQPLMPLRRGHIAMVLAAGLLDNMTVERGDTKLLVKGRLHKVQVDITNAKDRENNLTRTREIFQASITTLDLASGEITTLDDEAKLRDWLTDWQQQLAAKIVDTFQPLHRMTYEGLSDFHEIIATHSRYRRLPGRARTGLFEAQKQVTAALARRFEAGHDFAILQGVMGTGKTTCAASLADYLKKLHAPDEPFPVIVSCPPHLVEKWIREIAQIVPMAHAMEIRRPGDLEAYIKGLYNLHPSTLSIAVVTSSMLKLGSGWTPAVVRQPKRYRRLVKKEVDGRKVEEVERLDTFACPRCGQTIYERDKDGKPLYPITDPEYFERRPRKCDNLVRVWVGHPDGHGDHGHWKKRECGEPLYQQWRGKWIEPQKGILGQLQNPPEVRYPIAEYIARNYPGFFELAIVDEVHEMKGQSTDRGHAFGTLVRASKRTLAMTGTLFGGFATSLFYLLHRLDGRIRAEFTWSDGQRFASLYGVLERMIKHKDSDPGRDDYGHYTGLRRRYARVVERPGISPALVTKLLDSTVFLTLEDLGFELPEYDEHPVVLPMISGDGDGPDQAEVYRTIYRRLRQAALDDWSLMAEYLQTTLAWPNACWRDEETSLGVIPALPADRLYPKEKWLVQKCKQEQQRGRRTLVYCRQTATRDIQPRLAQLLRQAGLRTIILRSSVGTSRRERWVNNRVREGLDVMICNPRLVQTGLDLIAFPTMIFYEILYSIYPVQQASRRSWRLGQTKDVEVYFVVYASTMEHRAVAHVGKKVAAAQLLYGDDVAGALVDQAGVGSNFLAELAREVVANAEVPDLGELFVEKHRAVEASGWLLGEDGPDLSDRETRVPSLIHRPGNIEVDPDITVQLSMF